MTTTLGARIAQARRELAVRLHRDLSMKEIAEACGVDPSAVSLWEANKKTPREDALAKLAAFLGVTPQWLRYAAEPKLAPDADVIVHDGVAYPRSAVRRVPEAELDRDERIAEGARLVRKAAAKKAKRRRA
jgi:transcriptional regulator with XRE-family HTH domain